MELLKQTETYRLYSTEYNGSPRFMGQVSIGGGKVKRRRFATLAQAEAWAAKFAKERDRKGAAFVSLNEPDRVIAFTAFDRARSKGYDLLDALTHYEKWLDDQADHRVSTSSAADEYLTDCLNRGLRDRSINSLRYTLESFALDYGDRTVCSIEPDDVRAWLGKHDQWSAQSRNSNLTRLTCWFRWCIELDYLKVAPVKKSMKHKVTKARPDVLSVEDATKLLDTAFEMDKEACGLIAVQLFAGLRPAEAADSDRSGWERLHLDENILTVDGKVERQRRIVKVSDNLKAWLEACGGWAQVNVRKRIDAIKAAAGVEIPQNAMRHSFASYHLAAHENASSTAHELGHFGNLRMLESHYRAVVKQSEAIKWWKITPNK